MTYAATTTANIDPPPVAEQGGLGSEARQLREKSMIAEVEEVTEQVAQEVRRAIQIHRGMRCAHEAYAVILEELDEFWEQVKINPAKQALRKGRLRSELIQTAAMCVRAVIDLEL